MDSVRATDAVVAAPIITIAETMEAISMPINQRVLTWARALLRALIPPESAHSRVRLT